MSACSNSSSRRKQRYNETSMQLKNRGNELFAKGKYGAACDAYTEAILASPEWEIPYLNRAIANEKREKWKEANEDCEKCLAIDGENVKGMYHLGVCQVISEKNFRRASECLEKAMILAREMDPSQLDIIWRGLAKAKYLEHMEGARARKRKYDELEKKLKPEQSIYLTEGDAKLLKTVALQSVRDKDVRKIPPDALCCSLSLEMFREPVVSPSGNSYERSAIEQYVKTQKEKYPGQNIADPLSPNHSITLESLHPNIALRNIVREWLKEHPAQWGEILSQEEAEELEREVKKMKTLDEEDDEMREV